MNDWYFLNLNVLVNLMFCTQTAINTMITYQITMTLFNLIFLGEVPGWEFNISRNLNDYIHREKKTATIMPKDFCDNPSFLVIICISSPTGFEARRVIRSSWGQDRTVMGHNVSLYFLIGQTTDLELQVGR